MTTHVVREVEVFGHRERTPRAVRNAIELVALQALVCSDRILRDEHRARKSDATALKLHILCCRRRVRARAIRLLRPANRTGGSNQESQQHVRPVTHGCGRVYPNWSAAG